MFVRSRANNREFEGGEILEQALRAWYCSKVQNGYKNTGYFEPNAWPKPKPNPNPNSNFNPNPNPKLNPNPSI